MKESIKEHNDIIREATRQNLIVYTDRSDSVSRFYYMESE